MVPKHIESLLGELNFRELGPDLAFLLDDVALAALNCRTVESDDLISDGLGSFTPYKLYPDSY